MLVSVGIPTYNRAALLSEAIQSVLAQSFQDFELIVNDDCSSDQTRDVIFGFKDQRIRYFRSAAQLGVPANWNDCVRRARGEYFALLPDDDRYAPDFLSAMVEALAPEPALAFAQCAMIVEKSAHDSFELRVSAVPVKLRNSQALEWHLSGLACNPAVLLFRRSFMLEMGLWREDYWDDWAFILKLAYRHGFCYIPRPLTYIRDHENNLSKQLAASDRDGILDWINQLSDVFGSALPVTPHLLSLRKREERRLGRACVRAAVRKCRRAQWNEARELVTRAHKLFPLALVDPAVVSDIFAGLQQRHGRKNR